LPWIHFAEGKISPCQNGLVGGYAACVSRYCQSYLTHHLNRQL
jgi:hypothetical protein